MDTLNFYVHRVMEVTKSIKINIYKQKPFFTVFIDTNENQTAKSAGNKFRENIPKGMTSGSLAKGGIFLEKQITQSLKQFEKIARDQSKINYNDHTQYVLGAGKSLWIYEMDKQK